MFLDLYLLKINFIENIPAWIEAVTLVISGAGGIWFWWRRQEQRLLSSIEKAQGKLLQGYNSLIDELRLDRDEKVKSIKLLTSENGSLIHERNKLVRLLEQQQSAIESLRFFNKTLKRLKDAPDEVIEEVTSWLEDSPINDFSEQDKSVRDILLKRVESVSDTDFSNLPPSQG